MGVPRVYTGYGAAAVGTNLTLVTLIGATNIRPGLSYLSIGCSAAPVDAATKFRVLRCTTTGTPSASVTPQANDPGDPASLCTVGGGAFGGANEPTYTAAAINRTWNLNQRNTLQWGAYPGREIMVPATANNGLGIRSIASTGSAEHEAMIEWIE